MEKRKTIFIVSGSFRTGTSMMMKMLGEAGIGLFYTPIQDTKPEFNPDGYFEIDIKLFGDYSPSWMKDLDKRAIKVFPWLLHELPDDYDYKIIFMQRNILDSMRSTAKMMGTVYDTVNEAVNIVGYKKRMQDAKLLIASKPNMQVQFLQYEDVLQDPHMFCSLVQKFLNMDMDIEKMAAVPDERKKHFSANCEEKNRQDSEDVQIYPIIA